MSRDRRQRANRRGHGAEMRAALLLRLKGYRILYRGYRVPAGEIDIIARRGATIAFIEVKARDSLSEALHAVGRQQQARIARAAEHFMAHHRTPGNLQPRFDVVAVLPGRLPKHIKDAWQL